MAKFHATKEYQQCRSRLHRAGLKSVLHKLDALFSQAALGEELTAARHTKEGESRIPNAEKFALDDGYRLVTQLVADGLERRRVFLFAGTHDETEQWLERHRGFCYVVNPRDHKLDFIPLNASLKETVRIVNPEAAPQVQEQPLLRHLTEGDWLALGVSQVMRERLATVTQEEFSDERVMDLLLRLPPAQANALFDVMVVTNDGDPDKVRARLDTLRGMARPASNAEVVRAIELPVNADQYITFADPEDVKELLRRDAWEDWMLFLHPTQNEVAKKTYDGPARLRGVSGSGKTSIVVHRARHLARRYESPILVVTLTASLARLIDLLLDALCGVERNLISCTTTQGLAHDVVRQLAPGEYGSLLPAPDDRELRKMRGDALRAAGALAAWKRCPLPKYQADRYLDEELTGVREDFLECDRPEWVSHERKGRMVPLPAAVRDRILIAISQYEAKLEQRRTADSASMVLRAMHAAARAREVLAHFDEPGSFSYPFSRCVLIDEGQDLSANELRLLQALTVHTAPDALFVASDAAQRIFKRQTTLASVGFDVRGRATVFRKNYRNTAQILRAARHLLRTFDIVELDDGTEVTRIDVDFANREGSLPEVVRFESTAHEIDWIAGEIERLRRDEPATLGAGIGIVSASPAHREQLENALARRRIPLAQLRSDVLATSDAVKISTIETAKGHEFSVVFLPGMVEEVLPHRDASDDDVKRDAARLYVAMTRARERVVMTWTREAGARASRFLTSMMKSCQEVFVSSDGIPHVQAAPDA